MRVAVFGLGYVGFGLMVACARRGFDVIGVDVDESKVRYVNEGACPVELDSLLLREFNKIRGRLRATVDGVSAVKHCNVIVLCVSTSADAYGSNLSPLLDALRSVSLGLDRGKLVIIESTVPPGTTEGIARRILEESGLRCEADFYLAYCPERVSRGSERWWVGNIPRVVGGIGSRSLEAALSFYRSILEAEVYPVSSPKVAECAKLLENVFRDVNVALVNELALIFGRLGIDFSEVIKAASTKPFGFMPFYAGLGAGGECIPAASYHIAALAKKVGAPLHVIKAARKVNESMPIHAANIIESIASRLHLTRKITVLGASYKRNVPDTRGSMALKLIEELRKRGFKVKVYDPHAPSISAPSLREAVLGSPMVVAAIPHEEFSEIDLRWIREQGVAVIIDIPGIWSPTQAREAGLIYHSIWTT